MKQWYISWNVWGGLMCCFLWSSSKFLAWDVTPILTEKILADMSLSHWDLLRCNDSNTSTQFQQGRISRPVAASMLRDVFCICSDRWGASRGFITIVLPWPPHDNGCDCEQSSPLISFLESLILTKLISAWSKIHQIWKIIVLHLCSLGDV